MLFPHMFVPNVSHAWVILFLQQEQFHRVVGGGGPHQSQKCKCNTNVVHMWYPCDMHWYSCGVHEIPIWCDIHVVYLWYPTWRALILMWCTWDTNVMWYPCGVHVIPMWCALIFMQCTCDTPVMCTDIHVVYLWYPCDVIFMWYLCGVHVMPVLG